MHKVTFQFESSEDVTIFAAFGENLLDVARKANVAIDAPCSGNISCGKCKVQVVSGEVQSEITRHITPEEYDLNYRLACNCMICEDVTILVPNIASAYRDKMKVADLSSEAEVTLFQAVKQEIAASGIAFENDLRCVALQLDEPTMDDTMPDNERLIRELQKRTGAERVTLPLYVMQRLPAVLRRNGFHVKCTVSLRGTDASVYEVVGANEELQAIGLAVDIGTTSVSALAVDMASSSILAKASAGNAQIRFGADVINRIVESTREGGRKRLQQAIVEETINPLVETMCGSAGLQPGQIIRMCVASNPTMNHLFAGIDADPLRMEPFVPAFFELDGVTAGDLGLPIHPNAEIRFAPNVGSYVGGDITSGTLASMMWNKESFSLFIDLGTNGEIVFGNQDFLMSCACSAGPAFEGGDIRCGMRATDGAVEALTIDADTMEPTLSVIGNTAPVGICGSGIIDLIGELYRCGMIDAKGKFVREGRRISRDAYGIASYVLAFREETGSSRDLTIDEVDIDNFIRAKGAIFSAIRSMLSSLEMEIDIIAQVIVAGGIGSGINITNAIRIGMLPDLPLDCFRYIGNASLSGAYAMLLSSQAEEKVAEIGRSMTYLELSTNPGYMDEFIAACFLPHTDRSLFQSQHAQEP